MAQGEKEDASGANNSAHRPVGRNSTLLWKKTQVAVKTTNNICLPSVDHPPPTLRVYFTERLDGRVKDEPERSHFCSVKEPLHCYFLVCCIHKKQKESKNQSKAAQVWIGGQ